jgi:hypothetical protein
MKTIPFIFSIFITSISLGQDFTTGTRYLSVNYPSKAFQEELEVIGQNGDTILLEYGEGGSKNKTKYTYLNDKLYMEDSILFFDFGLVVGDTIIHTNQIGGLVTKITIDSIRNIMLGDGKEYLHFFARNVSSRERYTIIKGIGERSFGLHPFIGVSTIPEFVGVVSVCRDDTILYWRGDTDPTCDPNILQAKLGIDEQRPFGYGVYPNPTRDILYLAVAESVAISIVDVLGREIYKSSYIDRLDVSDFPKGVYLIYFVEDKKIYRTKFIKE